MDFAIVNFPETQEVEVIPKLWLDRDDPTNLRCWWPPFKSSIKIREAVERQFSVQMETWGIYNARVLGSFASYSAARAKLTQAEVTSNLESEDDEPKKRHTRMKISQAVHPQSTSPSETEDDEPEKNVPRFKKPVGKKKSARKIISLPQPPMMTPPRFGLVLAEGSGTQFRTETEDNNLPVSPALDNMKKKEKQVERPPGIECADNDLDGMSSQRSLTAGPSHGHGLAWNAPERMKKKAVMTQPSQIENEDFVDVALQRSFNASPSAGPGLTPNSLSVVDAADDAEFNYQLTRLYSKEFATPPTGGTRKLSAGPEFTRFENYVINALGNIEHKLMAQNQFLSKLCNESRAGSAKDCISEFNFSFPISKLEELEEFEKSLQNTKKFAALVDYLQHIGGRDYKECISNILCRILTDEVANHFCWEGIRKINGKFPFKDYKIKDAIFKAVKGTVTGNCSETTEHDFKKKAAGWLQHASDRIKQAEKKKNKQIVEDLN